MAEIRINGLANTAQTASNDDYVVLDGATNGTRKMLAKKLTEGVEQQLATTNQNVTQNTEDITDLKADLNEIGEQIYYYHPYSITTEIGVLGATSGGKAEFPYCVRTAHPQKIEGNQVLSLLNDNWRVGLYFYTTNLFAQTYYLGRQTYWSEGATKLNISKEKDKYYPTATFFGIVFFRWTGSDIDNTREITQEEINAFSSNYQIAYESTIKDYVKLAKGCNCYLVAASDSPQGYKDIADYQCTGTNDEVTIQTALDKASDDKKELWLATGNYSIDSFYAPDHAGDGYHAIWLKLRAEQHETVIKGIGGNPIRKYGSQDDIAEGAVLRVSQACYDGLDASTQYAVIAGNGNAYNDRKYPWLDMRIENIGIIIPDNQKKIIGIDGYYASRMYIKNIMLMCKDAITNLKNGVSGCIGIRGMCGSAFGEGQLWKHCFAWGFHTGYSVAGEHLVCIELGARFCDYGYRFNDFVSGAGATWLHPITLINCCDECDFNMPYFGNSGDMRNNDGKSGRQTFNLIDFNFEWLSAYTQYGGSYATEEFPGCTFANITYTVQGAYGTNEKNRVNIPFWASGQGINSRTVNMAHAQSGTTAERNTYAPTHMQQYYDTDLNKLLIYDGTNWRDTTGAVI